MHTAVSALHEFIAQSRHELHLEHVVVDRQPELAAVGDEVGLEKVAMSHAAF